MAYTEEELKWAKGLIQPELPEYTEADHEAAKLRFCMYEAYEELCDLYFKMGDTATRNPITTLEAARERLGQIMFTKDGGARLPDGMGQEEIDNFAKAHNWDYWKSEHLEGWHCGDCTAVAASCGKCLAESFYGFRTPYEGKSAGWKALHIFTNHRKEQEAAAGGPVNESTTGWPSYDLLVESKNHLSTVDSNDQKGS